MMKKLKNYIIAAFAAAAVWGAVSLYFTIAGRDVQGDFYSDWMPKEACHAPEENAYFHIKRFKDDFDQSDHTASGIDYNLRHAFLEGTTNRLALADKINAYLSAESNTLAVAQKILSSRGLSIPIDETDVFKYFSAVQYVASVYAVKATSEAVGGDIAKARSSLMDMYRIGRVLLDAESPYSFSLTFGHIICINALDEAAKPLFAPDEDEAWLKKVRGLCLTLSADGDQRMKAAVKRDLVSEAVSISKESPRDILLARDTTPLATVLLVFPGYARYALQSNRYIESYRASAEEMIRKLDEKKYDLAYARRELQARKNPFERNWLGEALADDRGWSCRSVYRALFRHHFDMRALATALACRSYKARHGAYPKALSDLVPEFLDEVPRDPFDGEELRYNAKDLFVWTPGERLSFTGKVKLGNNGKPYWSSHRNSRCIHYIERR